MELRKLEYFVALARERHFTRAAEAVHVSQPNLSKQIQELEREFGVPLLERLGRAVHLTRAGEELLVHAEAMLAEAEQIRLLMMEYRGQQRGRLVVGAMGAPCHYLMPQVAAGFKQRFPDVELVIESGTSQSIYQGLQDNSLHVGVAYLPEEAPWLAATRLFNEELVLVVPADHPLAGRGRLSVSELAEVPLMLSKDMACRRIIEGAFSQAGVPLRRSLEMASLEGLRATIAQGLGVTLLPRMYLRGLPADGRVVTVEIGEPPLRESFGLLVHRQRRQCEATRALIAIVHAEVQRLLDAPERGEQA